MAHISPSVILYIILLCCQRIVGKTPHYPSTERRKAQHSLFVFLLECTGPLNSVFICNTWLVLEGLRWLCALSCLCLHMFLSFVPTHQTQCVNKPLLSERNMHIREHTRAIKQIVIPTLCVCMLLIHDEGSIDPPRPQSQAAAVCVVTVSCWVCLWLAPFGPFHL